MFSDDVLHNCQSQPCTARLSRSRLVHPVEALEQAWQVFGRNSSSEVSYEELHHATVHPRSKLHLSPSWRVLDGIVHQIYEYLMNRIPVGLDSFIHAFHHAQFDAA